MNRTSKLCLFCCSGWQPQEEQGSVHEPAFADLAGGASQPLEPHHVWTATVGEGLCAGSLAHGSAVLPAPVCTWKSRLNEGWAVTVGTDTSSFMRSNTWMSSARLYNTICNSDTEKSRVREMLRHQEHMMRMILDLSVLSGWRLTHNSNMFMLHTQMNVVFMQYYSHYTLL